MKYLKTFESIKNGITFNDWLKSNPKNIDITKLDVSKNLIDLDGIDQFTNLRTLYCSYNQLTELPDLSNLTNLQYLYCDNNQLTSLPDLSNSTNLQRLYCYDNQLTSLPDLSMLTNLQILYCYDNQLPYKDLKGYLEWHKKEYPWFWDAKKYNL
jgi:Leucine-rich repeat (LRR) protein